MGGTVRPRCESLKGSGSPNKQNQARAAEIGSACLKRQIQIIVYDLLHRHMGKASVSSTTSIGGTLLALSYFEVFLLVIQVQAALPFLVETSPAPHKSEITSLLIVLVYVRGPCIVRKTKGATEHPPIQSSAPARPTLWAIK